MQQVKGEILGGGMGEGALQPDAHRLWDLEPHKAGMQRHGHIGDAYAQPQTADSAISGHMGIGGDQEVPGPGMSLLQKDLMTDTAAADLIEVFHTPSAYECTGVLVALRLAECGGGDKVVQDDHHLHARGKGLGTVLLQQRGHTCRAHIMCHGAVHGEKIDLSGLDTAPDFLL